MRAFVAAAVIVVAMSMSAGHSSPLPAVVHARDGETPKAVEPYYKPNGTLLLYSNSLWTGAVKKFDAQQSQTQEPSEYIWAASCSAAKQTVVFAREVNLLGPGKSLFVYWDSFGEGQSLTRLVLRINGRRVYSTSVEGRSDERLDAFLGRFLVNGASDVEVIVTKPKTSDAACNGMSAQFYLYAEHETDLKVSQERAPRYIEMEKLTEPIEIPVTATNDGPSDSPLTEVNVGVTGGLDDIAGLRVQLRFRSSGGVQCEENDPGSWQYTCRVKHPLKAETDESFTILMGISGWRRADESGDDRRLAVNWSVDAGPVLLHDENSENNFGRREFVLCGGSETAECHERYWVDLETTRSPGTKVRPMARAGDPVLVDFYVANRGTTEAERARLIFTVEALARGPGPQAAQPSVDIRTAGMRCTGPNSDDATSCNIPRMAPGDRHEVSLIVQMREVDTSRRLLLFVSWHAEVVSGPRETDRRNNGGAYVLVFCPVGDNEAPCRP